MAKFGEDSAASCAALKMAASPTAELCDDTFAALVRRQSQFVFRVAFSVLRNVQDAEDVVQETFFKIYRLGSWKEIKDEKAFLARVAWRIAVSRPSRFSGQPLSQETADESPNIEANMMTEVSETQVHRLVNALPLELRLPLALSTVDDMTSPEIAKVMGIPEGTVRTRLQRARTILKRKLEESGVRRG